MLVETRLRELPETISPPSPALVKFYQGLDEAVALYKIYLDQDLNDFRLAFSPTAEIVASAATKVTHKSAEYLAGEVVAGRLPSDFSWPGFLNHDSRLPPDEEMLANFLMFEILLRHEVDPAGEEKIRDFFHHHCSKKAQTRLNDEDWQTKTTEFFKMAISRASQFSQSGIGYKYPLQ